MRSLLIIGFAMSFGIYDAQSQSASAQVFSLAEAQAYAIKNNEQLKQAALDIQISEAKVKETTAIGLPQVNGEAGMNYYLDIPTQVAQANTFDPTAPADILVPLQFGLPYSATAGISASQLLFDGSYFVGLKASKAYLNYSQLSKESAEIQVKNQIAQTYFAVLSLDKTLESLKANKLTVDQSTAETKALYEVGFAEKQDADQVRLAQANLQYQIDMIERQRASVMDALKFQIGVGSDQEITLSETFEDLLGTVEEATVLDQTFSIQNHIDYRKVNQGIELSELSLSAEPKTTLN
jgi:outer membrane protein